VGCLPGHRDDATCLACSGLAAHGAPVPPLMT
jgi:hypothetical protein